MEEDTASELSWDIWGAILRFLPTASVLAFAASSKTMTNLIYQNELWLKLARERWDFGLTVPVVRTQDEFVALEKALKAQNSYLHLEVVSYDCQPYSNSYTPTEMLDPSTSTCFCTASVDNNVSVVFKLPDLEEQDMEDVVFFLTEVTIESAGGGYTAPLKRALVYAFNDLESKDRRPAINHLTDEEDLFKAICRPKSAPLTAHPFWYQVNVRGAEYGGYAAHVNGQKAEDEKICEPVVGKFILLHLLDAHGHAGSGLDTKFFGVKGFCYNVATRTIVDQPPQPKRHVVHYNWTADALKN